MLPSTSESKYFSAQIASDFPAAQPFKKGILSFSFLFQIGKGTIGVQTKFLQPSTNQRDSEALQINVSTGRRCSDSSRLTRILSLYDLQAIPKPIPYTSCFCANSNLGLTPSDRSCSGSLRLSTATLQTSGSYFLPLYF